MNTSLKTGAITLVTLSLLFPVSTNAGEDEPYLLDRDWEELMKTAPPLTSEVCGQRLVKKLEAKLNVKAPCWWQTLMQSVDVDPKSANMITNDKGLQEATKRWRNPEGVRIRGFSAFSISSDRDTVILGDGDRTLELSPQTAWEENDEDWATEPDHGISGMISGNDFLVVPKCPSEFAGGPRTLYCFDMKTAKLNWKADLVSGTRYSYTHLQFGSYTEVSVHDSKVIVWTASEIAAMVQAFNISDGKPLLRFASNGHRL